MKAMGKVKRHRDFETPLDYCLKGGQVIGGVVDETREGILKEFAMAARTRPGVEKPGWHCSYRLPEGEKMSPEKWVHFAEKMMERLGFTDQNPRVYVLHDDHEGQHVHVVASRVGHDGSLYLGRNENLRNTKLVAAAEHEFGLRITTSEPNPDRIKLSEGERKKMERLGISDEPLKFMQYQVGRALNTSKDMIEFLIKVEDAEIDVQVNASKTGKINGFAFEYHGMRIKSSDLSRNFSFGKISAKLGFSLPGEDLDQTKMDQSRNKRAHEMLMCRARGGEIENQNFEKDKVKAQRTRHEAREKSKAWKRSRVAALRSASAGFVKHTSRLRGPVVSQLTSTEKYDALRRRAEARAAALEMARREEEKRLELEELEIALFMSRQARERDIAKNWTAIRESFNVYYKRLEEFEVHASNEINKKIEDLRDKMDEEKRKIDSDELADRQAIERENIKRKGHER